MQIVWNNPNSKKTGMVAEDKVFERIETGLRIQCDAANIFLIGPVCKVLFSNWSIKCFKTFVA